MQNMRTEFTCPKCREYDSFEARPLRELEGFKKLVGATLYVCGNCDCALISSDEFSCDDMPDFPLIWPDEEAAIRALLEFEQKLLRKDHASSVSRARFENLPELMTALDRVASISPSVAAAAEFVEDEFSLLLRFVNVSSFNHYVDQKAGPPTYAVAIQGEAVVYRNPQAHNRCVYRINITPMPAKYAGSNGIEIDTGRVIEFARAVDPLLFSRTTSLDSFLRLMFAPAGFFAVMLDRMGRAMASEAANDEAWTQ